MKKLITSLLIGAQINAATPKQPFSSANEFKSDSVARTILIEDALGDGKIGIGTVERAYPYAKPGGDLERAMWLALMKDPTLLEDYMGQGMGRKVNVLYPKGKGVLGTAKDIIYYTASGTAFLGMMLLLGWMERQPNNQIIINTSEK